MIRNFEDVPLFSKKHKWLCDNYMPGENVKTLKIRYKQIINVPNKKTLSGGKKKKMKLQMKMIKML